MATQSKVELVLQSNSTQAINAFSKLLDKINEVDETQDKSTKKGSDGFFKLGGAVSKLAGMFTAGGAMSLAIQAFQFDLDKAFGRIEAMIRLQEKANQLSRSFSDAVGNRMINNPGGTVADLNREIAAIQGIASRHGLGEGSNAKLMDAYTSVRSSNVSLSESQALSAVNEAGELAAMDPTRTDIIGVARSIADIQKATGLDANQAQNFLQIAQKKGRMTDPAAAGKTIAMVVSEAAKYGIPAEYAAGMASYASRTLLDPTGDETSTALISMLSNLATRGHSLSKITGMDLESLPVLDRYETIAKSWSSFSEATQEKIFPKFSRGTYGKRYLTSLAFPTSDNPNMTGFEEQGGDISDIYRLNPRQGDFASDSIGVLRGSNSGFAQTEATRKLESQFATSYINKDQTPQEEWNRLQQILEYEAKSVPYQDKAKEAYLLAKKAGLSAVDSETFARQIGKGSRTFGARFATDLRIGRLENDLSDGTLDDPDQIFSPGRGPFRETQRKMFADESRSIENDIASGKRPAVGILKEALKSAIIEANAATRGNIETPAHISD